MFNNPLLGALIVAAIFAACQPAHADCDETINAETIEIGAKNERIWMEKSGYETSERRGLVG